MHLTVLDRVRVSVVLGGIVLALGAGVPPAVAAPPFNVNSTLDEHDSVPDGNCVSTPSGVCTLRAAIEEVNNVSLAGNINVPAGTYVLSLGDLDITASPTISGADAGSTIIDGGAAARVFEIKAGGFAYMEKLTVRNGMGGPSTVFPGHIHGGGIHNHGTLILVRSTVRDSTASSGGGITNAGTGTLTLVNVTITDNTASSGYAGGFENLGSATLTNVTISHNVGALAGGLASTGAMKIVNTIVAANGATNCSGVAEAAGSTNNLDSGNTCGFAAATDKVNQDPLLGALAADGTRPLGVGSPAIDAGDTSATNCPSTDERGVARPQDGDGNGTVLCDIGAYEKDAASVPPAVTAFFPAAGATGVARSTNVTVTFSEPMNQAAAQGAFSLVRTSSGAVVRGAFSWSGNTMIFDPASNLAAGALYTATVTTAATDLAGAPLAAATTWQFMVIRSFELTPTGVSIGTGTLRTGDATRLRSNDDSYFQVDSTTSGTRSTAWYGRFSGVPLGVTNLRVLYRGKNSVTCTQTLYLWSFTTSSWVSIDSRTVGTVEVKVAVVPPGAPGNYVGAGGELRFRVVNTARSSFYTSGDVQKIFFDAP